MLREAYVSIDLSKISRLLTLCLGSLFVHCIRFPLISRPFVAVDMAEISMVQSGIFCLHNMSIATGICLDRHETKMHALSSKPLSKITQLYFWPRLLIYIWADSCSTFSFQLKMASWQKVGYKVHWITVSISISTALYNRTNFARCHKREPGYGIGVRYLWCQFLNVSGVWISICFLYSYYLSFSRAATRTNDQVLQYLKVNEQKVHILDKRIAILRQLHHSCTLIKIEYETDGEIDEIWN